MVLLSFLRYGVPLILFLAGWVLLFAGGDIALEGWALCVGAALALITWNVLFRIGFSGDKERAQEEDARRYLAEHGHWPDEPPPER